MVVYSYSCFRLNSDVESIFGLPGSLLSNSNLSNWQILNIHYQLQMHLLFFTHLTFLYRVWWWLLLVIYNTSLNFIIQKSYQKEETSFWVNLQKLQFPHLTPAGSWRSWRRRWRRLSATLLIPSEMCCCAVLHEPKGAKSGPPHLQLITCSQWKYPPDNTDCCCPPSNPALIPIHSYTWMLMELALG